MATPMEDRVAGRTLTEKSRASVERGARSDCSSCASTPGPKVTNLEAHEAILNFYYPLDD